MNKQEIDRIECAIRHIESSLDVDPWAVEIAVDAMKKQIPKKPYTNVIHYCDHITGEEIMVSPNDYCSWAEKEERRDGQ